MIDLTDEDVVMAGPSNPTEAAPPAPQALPLPNVPAANEQQVQEIDRFGITDSITKLYDGFLAMYREELLLNNANEHATLNYGTLKHRKMMVEVDRYFQDPSPKRVVDAELIRYLHESDTGKMNAFDRVRMNLISLDVERGRVENNRLRLLRRRGNVMTDDITCPICLVKFGPESVAVTATCGHVVCQGCIDQIFQNLREACPCCRKNIDREEIDRLWFKFNHSNDAICRICDEPFRATDEEEKSCHYLRCGHSYHKDCLDANNKECTACNTILGNGEAHQAFLNYE